MAVKNKSASALARLRNQAKEEGISYQMSLQLFFRKNFYAGCRIHDTKVT